jgi:hypothetical protein
MDRINDKIGQNNDQDIGNDDAAGKFIKKTIFFFKGFKSVSDGVHSCFHFPL